MPAERQAKDATDEKSRNRESHSMPEQVRELMRHPLSRDEAATQVALRKIDKPEQIALQQRPIQPELGPNERGSRRVGNVVSVTAGSDPHRLVARQGEQREERDRPDRERHHNSLRCAPRQSAKPSDWDHAQRSAGR